MGTELALSSHFQVKVVCPDRKKHIEYRGEVYNRDNRRLFIVWPVLPGWPILKKLAPEIVAKVTVNRMTDRRVFWIDSRGTRRHQPELARTELGYYPILFNRNKQGPVGEYGWLLDLCMEAALAFPRMVPGRDAAGREGTRP